MKFARIALTLIFTAATTGLYAQIVAPAAAAHPQTIHQRKVNQQARIAQGVRSGQLTARETRHLEHQQRVINREQRNMRAQNDGHLTRQDRRTIRHQQNQESRRIYNKKHNARVR
ncbi:MAG: hypothetical protein ACYC46_05270 [Acidobacteriaceae bacterium]